MERNQNLAGWTGNIRVLANFDKNSPSSVATMMLIVHAFYFTSTTLGQCRYVESGTWHIS
jgi:hypothetical protein